MNSHVHDYFCLAVKKTDGYGTHCGIVYQNIDGSTGFIHLAWHNDLRNERFNNSYTLRSISLDESEKKMLAAVCGEIAKRGPEIPYGLERANIVFDPIDGAILNLNSGKGLTCASFVLTVLKTYDHILLNESEWPENANTSWQEYILRLLSGQPGIDVGIMAADIGARRFTPCEVVASGPEPEWPVGFERAQNLGGELLATI